MQPIVYLQGWNKNCKKIKAGEAAYMELCEIGAKLVCKYIDIIK
jgi:hypothetical protein